MKRKSHIVKFGALYAVVLGIALVTAMSCNPVIMVAPPGSTLQLVANPRFISAHGGVSEIAAIVMKSTGVPVADGTVVQFFTTLGRIEEQGKTNDGVARVKLVSDSRSGTANVSAFSGGGSITQPTATATGTATSTPIGTATATVPPPSGGGGGGVTSNNIEVVIGNTNVSRVLVNAVPSRITTGLRRVSIVATAFDSAGNPIAQVPIFFRVESNRNTEFMDSSGNPVFTDNNGRAEDFLQTRADPALGTFNVTVHADPPVGQGGTVVVPIY
jgi:hypothetical protein